MSEFSRRFGRWMEEVVRYSRYMANGGLLFTVYFALLYGAIVYGQFLRTVEATFPTEWLVAAVFVLMPLGHRPRTLLEEADQVFLLPRLGTLGAYLYAVRLWNVVFASMRALLVMLVLVPLIVRTMTTSLFELFVIVLTAMTLSIAGRLGKLENVPVVALVAGVLSALVIVSGGGALAFVPGVIAMGVLHVKRKQRVPLLEWLKLEEIGKNRFYRVVNWFVDVPALAEHVQERRLLVGMLKRTTLRQADAGRYLFGLQLLRAKDSLDLVLRLTFVGLVLMWLAGGWYVGFVTPIFVGLTSLQLVPLFKRLDVLPLTRTLPIAREQRLRAYVWWIVRFQYGQTLVLTLGALLFGATWDAFVGSGLALVIVHIYLRRLRRV